MSLQVPKNDGAREALDATSRTIGPAPNSGVNYIHVSSDVDFYVATQAITSGIGFRVAAGSVWTHDQRWGTLHVAAVSGSSGEITAFGVAE